jgi:hypothetical protein
VITFDRITPEYRTELEHIWTLREVPTAVRKLLALPLLDEGIDFIARTRRGKYWAIQSKFRSQYERPLTRKELGTFTSPPASDCEAYQWAQEMDDVALTALGFEGRAGFQYNYDLCQMVEHGPRAKDAVN